MERVREVCVYTLYVCVCWCESVDVSVCLLTAGGETSHLLDMRPVESPQCISPPPGEYVNTHNTNPLTHMEIYIIPMRLVYLPIRLSILPPAPLSSSSSSSSFLIFLFLFLAVCAVIGRSFVIQQIPSSNLFMVVVDNKCDCSMFEPITMDPIEIMYILHWPKTGEVGVIE